MEETRLYYKNITDNNNYNLIEKGLTAHVLVILYYKNVTK
ncbi:hypothetical protein CF9_0118 [Staphylococcus phage CF9]|uniref:Uncharacterized protein n=1 Tax=Staphylococcus phage CF9 TaxID=3113741 RepID=A0AAX4J750_9CAUD|nr:hypothetical protein CF9_0118 [Staphylococcus phage CF9]